MVKKSLEGPSCSVHLLFGPVRSVAYWCSGGGGGSSQLHPAGEVSNKAGSTKASFSTGGQRDAEQWRDGDR